VAFGNEPDRRGQVNARARVSGTLADHRHTLAIVFDRTFVTLPPLASPDERQRRARAARETEGPRELRRRGIADAPPVPVTLSFRTENPIAVRRNDMDAELDIDVTIEGEASGARSRGTITIRGGTLRSPQGPLVLEPSTLTFDGRDEPDPILDVSMLATTGGDRGTRMRMRGRLSAPEMTVARIANGREGAPISIRGQGGRAEDMERRRAEMVEMLGTIEEAVAIALSEVLSRARPRETSD
jgi:hypothetical protein